MIRAIRINCTFCVWQASGSGVDPIVSAGRLRRQLLDHVEERHPDKFNEGPEVGVIRFNQELEVGVDARRTETE